jgi:Fe-S oxidoreductase
VPASSAGDLDAARALARKNIEALEAFPDAVVLLDDSSCAATFKEYPSLFAEDPSWLPRARAVASRAKDLSEWLESPSSSPAAHDPSPASVTYHDPCKARYAQKLTEPPRRLLKSLAGVEYKELPEADQCCGGGGAVSFLQPDLSAQVGDRKARNIGSTGAGTVLTSSVSCLLQLRLSLRRAGVQVEALHIAEFLAGRRGGRH